MSANLIALWRLTHGSRVRFGVAVAALLCASVFLYLAPLVPQAVLDGVLDPNGDPGLISQNLVDAMGGASVVRRNLWIPAALVVVFTVVAGGFTYTRDRIAARTTEALIASLRARVFDHLQRLPIAFFDEAESGDLIQRCTSDIDTLRTFYSEQLIEAGRALVLVLLPIPLMLSIDARMTLVSVVMVPWIVGFSAFYFRRLHRDFLREDEAEAKLTAATQENIAGIRVVRAFARQSFERERFGQQNENYRRADSQVYVTAGWFWGIRDTLCFLQQAIVVSTGIYFLSQGSLSAGGLLFFLTVVSMFVFPLRHLGRVISDLGKASVALGRIVTVLERPVESQPEHPLGDVPSAGTLRFENVTFGYGEGTDVLRDVSFELTPRSTLAIVGPPGAGKSTIVALLMRLYRAQKGTIRLDGADIGEMSLEDIRSRLSIVQQEPYLFSRTIAENLEMARTKVDASSMVEATKAACVHEAINAFEHGYGTKVGERGVTLSGGQRQRIAIARALLREPSILVLDDALSAVDTQTEEMILRALARRRGRHSTIVITHRLSTLAIADQVLVLDRGVVVESGTLDQLRDADGPFAQIWARQTGQPKEEVG